MKADIWGEAEAGKGWKSLVVLIALTTALAFGIAFEFPLGQKAYAADGTLSVGAVTTQATSASKTCALYTSKGTLVRCTSAGKQVSGAWGGLDFDSFAMPSDVKTLYIASDVKTLKATASYSYVANSGSSRGKTLTAKQKLKDIAVNKLVFLTNSKGVNSCASIAASTFIYCDTLKTITGLNKTRITSIGANAFDTNESLTSISLPSTLKTIGKDCFASCTKLTTVSGLNKTKLTSIPDEAFAECWKLTGTVSLPSTCQKIGVRAFAGCKVLKKVTFDKKLSSIGENAFARCAKITSVDLPASVKTVNESAFWGCSTLKKATLRSTSIVKTSTTAALMSDAGPFSSTPIAKASQKAYIYVPKALVSKYKSNSKWKVYKSKYRAI